MSLYRSYKRASILVIVIFSLSMAAFAQKKKSEYIMATAQGTSTQLGQMISVDLIINELSTAEDQKVLIDAFQAGGSQGLSNTLDKMQAKGRIRITGTLGFDVNYIREFKMADGSRKIRFVTDRPIRFGEAWTASRSMDYNLSLGEIIISKDKSKSTGTIVPAAQFQIDKDKELSVEAHQNPWHLVNIRVDH